MGLPNVMVGGGGTATVKQPPKPDLFSQVLLDHFDALDADGDGELSRDDIGAAVDDPALDSDVSCVAATLWLNEAFGEVDEDDDKRLARAEVSQYNRLRRDWADSAIRTGAEEIMRIKNTIASIEQELKQIDQRAAGASSNKRLKQLKRRADTLKAQKKECEDVRDANIKQARKNLPLYNKRLSLFNDCDTYFEDFRKKVNYRTYQNKKLFDPPTPSYKQIEQQKEGTCTIAATVASLCHRRPQEVQARINGGPNNYEVALNENSNGFRNISVAAPTDAHIALYDHSQNHGLWMTVLYRAIGQWVQNKSNSRYRCYPKATMALTRGDMNNDLPNYPGDDWEDGGNLAPALRLLIQGPIQGRFLWTLNRNLLLDWARDEFHDPDNWQDYFDEEMSIEELDTVLRHVEKNALVATAGRGISGLTDTDGNRVERITNQTYKWKEPHTYAIIGYEPDTSHLATGGVTLYDPHGDVVKTSFEEFHVAFDNIAWEGNAS